ncbi:MAG: DUF4214 domain-containing protein [Clostridiales bacterium]|nr:DUF4214 domain-containing protein [Clostridiales bacterium]
MKKSCLISLAALAVTLPIGFCVGTNHVNADNNDDGSVTIDETNFPDAQFRSYVIEKIDEDGDGVLSQKEITATSRIDVAGKNISSLKGIEYFDRLEWLCCNNNSLTSLDLSQNPRLDWIDCSSNQLANLELGENDALFHLHCENNLLTKLDVSKCSELDGIICSLEDVVDHFYRDLIDTFCCYDMEDYSNMGSPTGFGYGQLYYDKNTRIIFSETPDLPDLPKFSVTIDEESFPDSSFRQFVTRYDENGDGSLDQDELYYIDTICVDSLSIKSLKGIEYFNNLKYLYCNYNELTVLELQSNDNLTVLSCIENNLSVICLAKSSLTDLLEEPPFSDKDGCRLRIGDNNTMCFWYEISECALFYDVGVQFVYGGDYSRGYTKALVGSFIERLYTIALNRPSEKEGKDYWVDQVEGAKASGGACARFFLLEADEFLNRGISDEDFVETLYKTFFDRASEAGGKDYWVGELKNGTKSREDVINGFIDSTEWCNLCASYGVLSGAPSAKADKSSESAKNFATRLYTCCLKRDPEAAGLKYWGLALTNLEKSGYEAAKFFFTSDEFKNMKTSNEEYVTRLYTTFMDREPEKEGFNYWVGELKKGMSRDEVLDSFARSQEFVNICVEYKIKRGSI